MNYQKIWDKVLEKDEEVKHEFSISSRYLNVWFIFWAIIVFTQSDSGDLTGGIMFLGIVAFYLYFYKKISRVYAFTDKRIVVHVGWLSTKTISIDYNQITDIKIEEPFWGKIIYKTGVLQIATAGTGSPPVRFRHINEPYELKKKLDSLRGKNNNVSNKGVVGKDNFQNKKDEIAEVNKKYGMDISVKGVKKDVKNEIKKMINPICWIPGIGGALDMKDDLKEEKNTREWRQEMKKIKKKYKENNL